MDIKGSSSFNPSLSQSKVTGKSQIQQQAPDTQKQQTSIHREGLSKESSKTPEFKHGVTVERSPSASFTGENKSLSMSQDKPFEGIQNKMQSLSKLTKTMDEAKLMSNPAVAGNIMKNLTEIALPLLGSSFLHLIKEGETKGKDSGEIKGQKNEKEAQKSNEQRAKDNKSIINTRSFSKFGETKKLINKDFATSFSMFGEKTGLKSDIKTFAQLRLEVITNPNVPSQEQLRQAVKNAATAIWDILKKAKNEDEKESLTSALLNLLMKLHSAYTFEHSTRVMELTMALANEIGLEDQEQLENLKNAAFFKDIGQYGPDNLSHYPGKEDKEISCNIKYIKDSLRECSNLHDIGKMKIPDTILNKNGPLNDEEFKIIKQHPLIGVEIVKPFPDLHGAIPGIRGHHEKWNGFGYPDGKKGLDIPVQARIISICDTFDAMTEDRPYRKALTTDEAVKELIRCSGTQFDPTLVPAFIYGLSKKGEINITIYEEDIKALEEKFNFTAKKP